MEKEKKGKVVVITLSPAADLSSARNGNAITPIFPVSPVSRAILGQFLRGNAALKRLADGMVWGHISAAEYQHLTDGVDVALKGTDAALRAVLQHLKKIDKERGKHKGAAKAETAKKPEPAKAKAEKKTPEVVFT